MPIGVKWGKSELIFVSSLILYSDALRWEIMSSRGYLLVDGIHVQNKHLQINVNVPPTCALILTY